MLTRKPHYTPEFIAQAVLDWRASAVQASAADRDRLLRLADQLEQMPFGTQYQTKVVELRVIRRKF